ncbi:hypothetical protein GCM10027594_20940 [Hymenobacter agri]
MLVNRLVTRTLLRLCLTAISPLLLTPVWAQNTIMWKVAGPDVPAPTYILGTFHQMGNSFLDRRPLITQALLAARVAAFESVEDKEQAIVAVINARLASTAYQQALDPADAAYLATYSKAWLVPLDKLQPAELLVKLQQDYVAQNCGTVLPTDTATHMDDYLLGLARRAKLPVVGLETYTTQFKAINATPTGELTWEKAKPGVHFWVESLAQHKNQAQICAVAKEYLRMRFDYQFKVPCAPANELVIKRNQQWLPKVKELVQTGNAFIAVGQFHLYGACGLLQQLRDLGYAVTAVAVK